jgi:hypothetical protein
MYRMNKKIARQNTGTNQSYLSLEMEDGRTGITPKR